MIRRRTHITVFDSQHGRRRVWYGFAGDIIDACENPRISRADATECMKAKTLAEKLDIAVASTGGYWRVSTPQARKLHTA